MSLTKQSGCKINLLLNILGKRDDGFHELETVMQPIPLFDQLEFSSEGPTVNLTCNHPDLPCDGSNLIVKAADAFRSAANISDGVRIHLEKHIPMEAGMAGGSSNAAATLLGLNELFGQPLQSERLIEIAQKLGSDVPFFLQNHPALATGRGETIKSLNPFASLQGLSLVLVHPGFGISTPWSYKTLARFPEGLNGRKGRAAALINSLESEDRGWSDQLFNSLELPAFKKYPVLKLYVKEFKDFGATASLMSGSGSTVFAYFPSTKLAESGLESFQTKFGNTGWSTIIPPQSEE